MIKGKNLKTLFFLGFILALSTAFPGYIKSSFVEEFVDLSWVGAFFVGAALLSLLTINFFPYFIKKFSNYWLAVIVTIINIISIILLIAVQSPILVFIFFAISGATIYLIWINMDVFLERFTSNVTTGRIRTLYFTCLNFGWLFSPLIVGYLVGEKNYRLIYILSALLLVIFLIILLSKRRELSDHLNYQHHSTAETLRNIWKNLNLRRIFIIAFLLEVFYVIAVIYMPIYLHETIGFDWLTIGALFTVMLLPFVILEIPAGWLADKYISEKRIFALGFLIISAAVALFFFTKSNNFFVWAMVLLLSRCGAALIESMRESYFFKIVDVQDIDYINFFRNLSPLSYLIISGLSIILLNYYPIEYIFICLAIILLSGIYFSLRLGAIVRHK